jgi:hypothetical protein
MEVVLRGVLCDDTVLYLADNIRGRTHYVCGPLHRSNAAAIKGPRIAVVTAL